MWKHTAPWEDENTADSSGHLQLGAFELSNYYWATGWMMLDELVIWEQKLSCDDVYTLFNAYV